MALATRQRTPLHLWSNTRDRVDQRQAGEATGRVAEVYELISDKVTRPDIDVSKPKSKSNPDYYQVKKLIRKNPEFGLSYEIEHRAMEGCPTFYWVSMSTELEDLAFKINHELGDSHGCYGLDEVWDRLKEMVEFSKANYSAINKQ
tara:strand:+ start:6543 stop:6980 length:438 start_codon:yes stop_codon:yes gene_type:complete